MSVLELKANELDEMKEFYMEELDRTMKRLEHIQAMLKKLGAEGNPAGVASNRVPVTRSKPRKRAGRKSKWEALILKRLRQLDKPVTYDELTDEIMVLSKLPEEKRESTRQAIVSVVFRLRNRDERLDTFSAGVKEKYIALKPWFDVTGQIKKEYADKIDLPKSKTG